MLEKIKAYARELGADARCDGWKKGGYYQVIDWVIEKFPQYTELILDNGDAIYEEYSAKYDRR